MAKKPKLPDPPVPATLDLQDYKWMPFDVVTLKNSSLVNSASLEELRAALILWCECWHQIPASSLPDDDRALAKLAGFGRDIEGWKAVREVALKKFYKCSDGRLYHPIIATKALNAHKDKLARIARTQTARQVKAQKHAAISVTGASHEFVAGSNREEKRGEEKREERKKEDNLKVSQGGEGVQAPSAKRATRLPDGWQPSARTIEIVRSKGYSDSDIAEMVEAMTDWAKGGGKPKLDWDATFRTWVRNQQLPRKGNNGHGPQKAQKHSRAENFAILNAIAAEQRRREAEQCDGGGDFLPGIDPEKPTGFRQ